jgi:hypothetical protein
MVNRELFISGEEKACTQAFSCGYLPKIPSR